MNPVAKFESFIERLMEQTFTRATRSHLQPVEIGKRLVRAMEAEQSVGVDGVLVPNVYDVYLSQRDFEHFEPMKLSLSQNMASHLGRVARQKQFHMVSRPLVRLHCDEHLSAGNVRVRPRLEDVAEEPAPAAAEFQHTSVLPAVESPLPVTPATPSLLLDDKNYAVLRSPTRVGRLPDNDIVMNDKRVSRHHAEVVIEGNRWVVRDMGSTNGTAVNGKIVREAPLKPGDTISLGGLEVRWEQ